MMVQANHKIGFETLRHTLLLAIQQPGSCLDMHDNRYALTGRVLISAVGSNSAVD